MRRVPEEAPEAVVQLMDACMEPDPALRPNARALVSALNAIVPPEGL